MFHSDSCLGSYPSPYSAPSRTACMDNTLAAPFGSILNPLTPESNSVPFCPVRGLLQVCPLGSSPALLPGYTGQGVSHGHPFDSCCPLRWAGRPTPLDSPPLAPRTGQFCPARPARTALHGLPAPCIRMDTPAPPCGLTVPCNSNLCVLPRSANSPHADPHVDCSTAWTILSGLPNDTTPL